MNISTGQPENQQTNLNIGNDIEVGTKYSNFVLYLGNDILVDTSRSF